MHHRLFLPGLEFHYHDSDDKEEVHKELGSNHSGKYFIDCVTLVDTFCIKDCHREVSLYEHAHLISNFHVVRENVLLGFLDERASISQVQAITETQGSEALHLEPRLFTVEQCYEYKKSTSHCKVEVVELCKGLSQI